MTRGIATPSFPTPGPAYRQNDEASFRAAVQQALLSLVQDGTIDAPVHTNASRPSAGVEGRIIFNRDDGQLNVDDGTNWVEADAPLDPLVGVWRDSGSVPIVNTGAVTIDFDTEVLDPSGVYATPSGAITISESGVYLVNYSAPINEDGTTGADQTRVYGWSTVDSGGGATTIVQSRSQSFIAEGGGGGGVSASFLAQFSSGDLLRVRLQTENNTDLSTETGQATLSIHRVST